MQILTGLGSMSVISGFWPRAWRGRATTATGVEAYLQLAMKAAALMELVARFHPLIGGNRRTAWTLMVLMLWINGYRYDFNTDSAFDLVVGL
ncbi:Fic family protein [Arthrobacter sp. D1-29]